MSLPNFRYLAILTAMLLSCAACRQSPPSIVVQNRISPAPPNSLVPQLTRLADGRFALSWQQKLETGGYTFAMALGDGDHWSDIRTIDSGTNLSMFTADLPGIAELSQGTLLAYWELKDTASGDPYATRIQTAISSDDGRTWKSVHQPYPDALAGQHSFLSWFPMPNSGIGLAWLDAQQRSLVRQTAMITPHAAHEHGAIGLRYASLGSRGETLSNAFIAPITCECCPTAAAITAQGPVVVYRGRVDPPGTQPSEVDNDRPTIRDIYLTRLDQGRWATPHRVHADDWVINACPDNGPAVDAAGSNVAVAWWTAAGSSPKVQVAFSQDAGDSFGKSIRVDASHAEGQVTVALLRGKSQGAVVGWLEDGQVRARFVHPAGDLGPIAVLGASPRHSRLPHWFASNGKLIAAWTEKSPSGPQVIAASLRIQN